jgi:CheY-like chemotaxis protein
MLGGEITVESAPSQGSTFSVSIATGPLDGVPLIRPSGRLSEGTPRTTSVDSAVHSTAEFRHRVLLVEDGPDNQRLISFFLRKAGAEVMVAENGQVAVDAVMAARDRHQPFDVILMDMQMPVVDGYAATKLLRQKGYRGPIIALTAHAMSTDREKCLTAGCDDYISKPIDRDKLLELVRQYAQKGERALSVPVSAALRVEGEQQHDAPTWKPATPHRP